MGVLTLDQLVACVQELPALPEAAQKVFRMTEDPNVSTREIGSVISSDIALTTRLLRIANSAYYGIPRMVGTISEAVVILGIQALRNLALAAATFDLMKGEFAGYGLRAGELWRHSVLCALSAQIIAKKTQAVKLEEAFVGGLLHDVGKVVLNVHVAPQFQAILALAELDEMPFHEAERLILGFDHAEVGRRVAEKWNLPTPLCMAIGAHHQADLEGDTAGLTAVIQAADAACYVENSLLLAPDPRSQCPAAALETLNLAQADLDEIVREAAEQASRSQGLSPVGRAA